MAVLERRQDLCRLSNANVDIYVIMCGLTFNQWPDKSSRKYFEAVNEAVFFSKELILHQLLRYACNIWDDFINQQ